jgi:transposase
MNMKKVSNPNKARVNRPERTQVEMRFFALDQLLDKDHRARIAWQFVESLDLQPLYERFKATEGEKGRNGIAPEILLSLWLMATIDSISSARELARRTTTDIPYMWLCGGVSVNYHTLSDFRSNNAEYFEKMLVDTVTAMMAQGFVTLDTIAQDGMRVRASAGSSSFRRQPKLEELHNQAKTHVEKLREESEDESKRSEADATRKAAQQRSARERAERIAEALRQVEELHDQKEKRKKGDGEKARCSTTDPDARKMKMGDGGFRPAYNVQFATDGDSRVIVGADVTNSGSDRGEMAPMHEKIVSTYGKTPSRELVDSAFATKEDVRTVEQSGTEVYSTVHGEESMKKRGTDPFARQRGDSEEYAAFRQRMSKEESQEIYKQRPSIAEFPNAECRNRGCRLLRVRGLDKVKSVMLLYASTFNLLRMMNLGAI